jgi:hypothetical protein
MTAADTAENGAENGFGAGLGFATHPDGRRVVRDVTAPIGAGRFPPGVEDIVEARGGQPVDLDVGDAESWRAMCTVLAVDPDAHDAGHLAGGREGGVGR